MKYAGIIYDDVVNGEGIGAVFFTQGCTHHCKGCQNPQTWDFNEGKELTNDVIEELFDYFKITPFVTRLTLSGGDPLDNIDVTEYIVKRFKSEYPDKSVWLFTGYCFEDIINNIKFENILNNTDVLIDGLFDISKRDITLKFRGSSNQNIYYKQSEVWKKEV